MTRIGTGTLGCVLMAAAMSACASAVTPDMGQDDAGPRGDAGPGAACDAAAQCSVGLACASQVCVSEGRLRFTLSWTALTDLDLHVRAPNGHEILYSHRVDSGGMLDVDDCVAEVCRNPMGTHVENIFFDDAAMHGTYEAWVVNYDGAAAASFRVDVIGVPGGPLIGMLPAMRSAQSASVRVAY